MRTRKILTGLTLGAALAMGAVMAPAAQAAPATSSTASASTADAQGVAASKHFYSSHWTAKACYDRASYWIDQHPTWNALCQQGLGTDGKMKWHLYMIY
jgi:pectin methylesterase-like acyl-CoA thioesterase